CLPLLEVPDEEMEVARLIIWRFYACDARPTASVTSVTRPWAKGRTPGRGRGNVPPLRPQTRAQPRAPAPRLLPRPSSDVHSERRMPQPIPMLPNAAPSPSKCDRLLTSGRGRGFA